MGSNQQDGARASISPVLFLTVDGEPMSFFLRPGPAKRTLQPLITAGGGKVCNVQQPGAVLLIHPDERHTIPESTSHWYVSTQYISDCIEKEEQLNLEDYRLNPEVSQRNALRGNSRKARSPAFSGGRVPYSPEEDAAILNYISTHMADIRGNRLWQEMEKQQVTSHTWQSMKYRYRARLSKLHQEAEKVETKEEDEAVEDNMEVEDNQETEVPKLEDDGVPQTHETETDTTQLEGNEEAEAQDDVLPQTHSAEMDQTQIEVKPMLPENEDPQTSSYLQGNEHHVNQQTEQPAESMQVETVEVEASGSRQSVVEDSLTDTQLILAEAKEPEPEPADPQQKLNLQEESIPHTEQASSSKQLNKKQKASPQQEQPQQRITRRKLELLSSPERYGKRLRSSSTPPEQSTASPRTLRKTRATLKTAPQKDTTTDPPPSRRVSRKSAAVVVEESQEELSGPDTVSETPQADETNSVRQKAEKKKEKRRLGILELATKEFEDGSESDEDEAAENPPEKAAPSEEPPPLHSDTAADSASPQPDAEPGPSHQENVPETKTVPDAVTAPSKAHLFIFESQEDASQSVLGDCAAAAPDPQSTTSKGAAFSLTQTQLEEDKQRITELMDQTNQDLVKVTKALLKTSGDFPAALNLLLNPSSVSGLFWNRHDDRLVLSSDPAVHHQLKEKYGEEGVAKRIMFLEVEG